MQKRALTVVVLVALAAVFTVLSGCESDAVAEEVPIETILVTGEQLYLASYPTTSASLQGSYTVKLMCADLALESVETGIEVGTVDDGSLSLDLQRLETSQLSPLFTGLSAEASVDPPNHNVMLVQKFQIYDAGGAASGTLGYDNEPRAHAYFLYSAGPLTVSASIPGLGLPLNFKFHAEPGWNRLWMGDSRIITDDPPSPLNAKWLYTAP